jgi:two-component system response regulator RstA
VSDPLPVLLPALVRVASVEIDVLRFTARLNGETHALTATALRLLCLLAANAGRVLTRQEIWDALAGPQPAPSSNAVDAQVVKLRRCLGDDAAHPRVVETVVGRGYRFVGLG